MMGIQSLVTYESPDIDGLEDAFQKAVDDYLETCRALCQAPDAPESLEEDLTS
jgi:predicted HicB family RNase H-like nuclease